MELVLQCAQSLTKTNTGALLAVSRQNGRVVETCCFSDADFELHLGWKAADVQGRLLWEKCMEGEESDLKQRWEFVVASANEDSTRLRPLQELEVSRRHRFGYLVKTRLLPLCQDSEKQVIFLYETPKTPLGVSAQSLMEADERKVFKYMARLSEVLNLGVWEWEKDSGAIWWSPKLYELFGRDPALGPMKTDEFNSNLHPDDSKHYLDSAQRSVSEGDCQIRAVRLRRADGTWWYAMAHLYAEKGDSDDVVSMWGIFFDDTKRSERERDVQFARERAKIAEEVNTQQQHFISYVFHEIRNPLGLVSLGLGSLADIPEISRLESFQEVFQSMDASIKIATDLLNNMIDLSRLEDGIFSMNEELVFCADVLDNASISHQAMARQKGVEIKVECCEETRQKAVVKGDRFRLLQVLMNLTGNALKFTGEGGILILSCELLTSKELVEQKSDQTWVGSIPSPSSEDEVGNGTYENQTYAVMSVEDTASGIQKDKILDLFKPFQQINALDKQRGRGAGIGLAICRRIAELHAGLILVESEIGKGSKFSIVLPSIPEHAVPERFDAISRSMSVDVTSAQPLTPLSKDSSTSSASLPGKKRFRTSESEVLKGIEIIVVEDDPIISRLLSQRLKKRGAVNVRPLPNGRELIKYLQHNTTSPRTFILLDDYMPVMTGTEVLKHVRVKKEIPFQGKIIVCSGNAAREEVAEFMKLGADSFMSKPISVDELEDNISHQLGIDGPRKRIRSMNSDESLDELKEEEDKNRNRNRT